MNKRR